MSRITLFPFLAALTATAPAVADSSALPVHCIRDGGATTCTLSMTQTVEPRLAELFGDPKAQPVPLCLDCAPLEVEIVCTLTHHKGEAPTTRCHAETDGWLTPRR